MRCDVAVLMSSMGLVKMQCSTVQRVNKRVTGKQLWKSDGGAALTASPTVDKWAVLGIDQASLGTHNTLILKGEIPL